MDNQPRIDELKQKLSARRRMPGYTQNIQEIEAEIARLEGAQGSEGTDPQPSEG
jgi:hypothetical protein